jgi:glycerophosphoryl diester phosphodiesterase
MTFQLVHHMAAQDGFPNPPNSLAAVEACLAADAAVIEVDITPLAGEDFLLVHDADLESETTGNGKVGECQPEQTKAYHLKYRGAVTEHSPALLSEVVAAFLAQGRGTRLQLDYKAVFPSINDEPLRRVIRLIEPLGARVIISSGADWHLRKLRRLASWLDLGFDIGFYLDWRDPSWEIDPRMPPYLLGAYGYYDDHLLAKMALLPNAAYLAERCDLLLSQLPDTSTWYVRHHLIARCLDDGFNMAAWLHENNVKLDAWTLDADKPAAAANTPRLRDAGIDLFTTNTPTALAALLNGGN